MVGLGGSATNDGGAGLLAALGATRDPPARSTRGPTGLGGRSTAVDLAAARARVAGVELVAASDVDNPLLGLIGATNVYGPQKGVADGPAAGRRRAARAARRRHRQAAGAGQGAGAAGGLGFALLLLGADPQPGVDARRATPSGWPSGPGAPTW